MEMGQRFKGLFDQRTCISGKWAQEKMFNITIIGEIAFKSEGDIIAHL